MRKIQWNNIARKQIKKISKNYQEAILQSVDELAGFPNCTGIDIKALKKHKYAGYNGFGEVHFVLAGRGLDNANSEIIRFISPISHWQLPQG